VKQYHSDVVAGLRRDDFTFLDHRKLTAQLKMTDGSLRHLVARIMRHLRRQAEQEFNAALADEEIIENSRWRGYRLNPRLLIVPRGAAGEPKLPEDMTFEDAS
jgi:hypothetical protein